MVSSSNIPKPNDCPEGSVPKREGTKNPDTQEEEEAGRGQEVGEEFHGAGSDLQSSPHSAPQHGSGFLWDYFLAKHKIPRCTEHNKPTWASPEPAQPQRSKRKLKEKSFG